MEDEDCPVCREELDEVLITDDKTFEWSMFTKKMSKRCEEDPEDDSIYYHNEEAKRASLQLRTLNCMINNCPHAR